MATSDYPNAQMKWEAFDAATAALPQQQYSNGDRFSNADN